MKRAVRRLTTTAVTAISVMGLTAGPALAHHCINPNKQPTAGAQVTLGAPSFDPVAHTDVFQKRIDRLGFDEALASYAGPVGIDLDGDMVADVSTYQVTPTGSLPDGAVLNGSECNGIIDPGAFMSCLSAEA